MSRENFQKGFNLRKYLEKAYRGERRQRDSKERLNNVIERKERPQV